MLLRFEGLPGAVLLGLQLFEVLEILVVEAGVGLLFHFALGLHLGVAGPEVLDFLLEAGLFLLEAFVLLGHLINVGFMTGRLYLLKADEFGPPEL